MRVNDRVPSKSLLLSVLILAAAAVLAIEGSTTLHARVAIEQPLPNPVAPQPFQEAMPTPTSVPAS